MRQRLSIIGAPPPFTYFEDSLGIIYYSHGVTVAGDDPEIRATAVYLPGAMPGEPERVSWATGRDYFKFISAGLAEERPALATLPSEFLRDALTSRLRRDPDTEEHYLAVPLSEVREVFSALDALKAFELDGDAGQGQGAPDKVRRSVAAAMNELVRAGVPREAIGLYGGLQCGIGPADGTVRDVDLLVHGHHHYATIVKHCRAKEMRWVPDERVRHSPLLHAYEQRRVRISESHTLLDDEELLIDIRTTPLEDEHIGAVCAAQRGDSLETVRLTGTVLDAEASLSLPACFIVQPQGQAGATHVVSAHHHLVGCASRGDVVEITGLRDEAGTVHLVDEHEHRITVIHDSAQRS